MNELKEKHLRPSGRIMDQFLIATVLTVFIMSVSTYIIQSISSDLTMGFFKSILGGDEDVAAFLNDYFIFIGLWVGFFLTVLVFKGNRPMLRAVKYCSPRMRGGSGGAAEDKGNCAGNNIRGFLIGLALGFGCNASCVLLSALMGDIHLQYNEFSILPFMVFLVCVFIQSTAEELTDRWYLYQKLRRRYEAPWIAIVMNSLVFVAMHLLNPGITMLSLCQIFVVGVLFSLFVYYYNGLWMAAAFHTAWNFTQSIFFGLPNSGIVSAYSVFKLDAASATNGLFYNVNFGVEGSPGAVVILTVLAVIVFLKNRGKGEHTDVWEETEENSTAL